MPTKEEKREAAIEEKAERKREDRAEVRRLDREEISKKKLSLCVADCFDSKSTLSYSRGIAYEGITSDHPCAMHFVDVETEKKLK